MTLVNCVYSDLLSCMSCRSIVWISGPVLNGSVMWFSLNESNVNPDSNTVITDLHPLDISVDPVSGQIFVLTTDNSILSVNSGTVVSSLDLEVSISLDVFEVFAYVIFESGIVSRVNIQGSSSGISVLMFDLLTNRVVVAGSAGSLDILGNISGSVDAKVLHPLKESYRFSKLKGVSCIIL